METQQIQEYCLGFAFYGHNVILIKKQRPVWQKGFINGVGGKVEEGESALASMVREFHEETGHQTQEDQWELVGTLNDPKLVNAKVHIFIARLRALQFLNISGNISKKTFYSDTEEQIVILDLFRDSLDYQNSKRFLYNIMDLLIETYKIYNPKVKANYWGTHPFKSMINRL